MFINILYKNSASNCYKFTSMYFVEMVSIFRYNEYVKQLNRNILLDTSSNSCFAPVVCGAV